MSTCEKVEKWLFSMGYGGKIPNDLRKICNPSTVHIWEQLIAKIKPKDEVDYIRKNIIINRLQQKSLEKQDEFTFPIKEIEVFNRKLELEKKLNELQVGISEKESQIDLILLKNKQCHIQIAHKKEKIKEHKQKMFLLENKVRLLTEDIKLAEEIFSQSKTSDEPSKAEEETLNHCAKEIRKRFEQAHPQKNQNVTKHPVKRRESLGLLPADLWNTSDEFDDFLSFNRSNSLEAKNLSLIDSPSTVNKEVDWLNELCSEENIKKTIENLLETKSIEAVQTSWKKLYQKLLNDFSNKVQNELYFKPPEMDLNELYVFHLKTELEKEKMKRRLDALVSQIAERKERILHITEEQKALFEMYLEEIRLKAANSFLLKTATTSVVIEDQELPIIEEKINKIKTNIVKKTAANKEIIEKIYKVFRSLESVEHVKSLEIRRLNLDLFDPNIHNNIKEEVITKEIEQFCEFPISYHFQTNINQNYRLSTTVPSYVDLTDKNANKISLIIDVPYSPTENIILNIIQLKSRLRDLQSLEFKTPVQQTSIHCNKLELSEKKKCIEETVITLTKMRNSAEVKKILNVCDYIKEVKRLKETKPWEPLLSEII